MISVFFIIYGDGRGTVFSVSLFVVLGNGASGLCWDGIML